MMKIKLLLSPIIIFLMMGTSQITYAQSLAIQGKVTNEDNEPLSGVSVSIQGGAGTTSTDTEGAFSLAEVPIGAVLELSYLGYVTQLINVQNRTSLNVTLIRDSQLLDEIVVVGYGSMERQKVTSAITTVKPKDFNRGNINSPAQLLQGKVAGLSIVSPQGNPNGTFNIRLRGLATLGANTQPLVIIDGVIGADISSVDPNDIASMDILKDGAAAAIYGTRGSTGVIIISTKTGVRGKSTVAYNAHVAAEQMDRSLPIMSQEKYLENGGTDYGGSTDWMDEITRTALSHVHNLSLSGGSESFTYMSSLNYRNVEGIVHNTGNNQLNGRLNLNHKTWSDRLTLNLNLALNSQDAKMGFDDVFRSAIIMPPTAPVKSDEATYEQYGGYFQNLAHELFNPMAIINQNQSDRKTNHLTYNIQGNLKIVNGLSADVRFAQNEEKIDNGQYISRYSLYGSGIDRKGLASRSNYSEKSDLFEVTGNYLKSFQGLDFNILGGYSYQKFTTQHYYMQAGNFLTDEFSYNNISAARDFADGLAKGESLKESNKLIAFFSRLNLSYEDTYFLMASLRHEGSSRFGNGNKWGNFMGLSAGVDISRIIEIPNVDQLKIRASYGITGALPDQSYLSQQIYGPGSNLAYFLYNDKFTPVYSPQSNPNPNLKWEKKAETDIGFDLSMFQGRLNGSFDFYNRKTTDALIRLNVPVPPNLFPTSILNAGELQNKGVEASLSFLAVDNGDFTWNTRLTYATNDAKVISLSLGDIRYGTREVGGLPAPLTGNVVRVEEGGPIGQIVGWVYEGVDASGNYIIKDVDNDGVINERDVDIIGRGLPKGEFGLSNTFTYKNLDFSFFFRGVYGHDLINLHRTMFEQVSRISTYNLINTKHFDPAYKGPVAYNSNYVEDASFVKLENLSLGYQFSMPKNSIVSAARIFVTGQNLFYITGYSGVDPEPRYSYDNNVLAPGVEPLNSWVTTRTFSLGVNITF